MDRERFLPCPRCTAEGRACSKIGNRRGECKTCNRFAQKTRRAAIKKMRQKFPEEFEEIQENIEDSLYRASVNAFKNGQE